MYLPRPDGSLKPFLEKSFFTLTVDSEYRPQHARVVCRPTVVISLRLASLPEYGCPAKELWGSLLAYYTDQLAQLLLYIDVPYDVKSTEDAADVKESLADALKKIHE